MELKQTGIFGWLDFATSGVDPDKDVILYVHAIMTTGPQGNFTTIAEQGFPIKCDELPDGTSDFVLDMHSENGILEACLSKEARPLAIARSLLVEFFRQGPISRTVLADKSTWHSPLCGFGTNFERHWGRNLGTVLSMFDRSDFDVKGLVRAGLVPSNDEMWKSHPAQVLNGAISALRTSVMDVVTA